MLDAAPELLWVFYGDGGMQKKKKKKKKRKGLHLMLDKTLSKTNATHTGEHNSPRT